MRVQSMAAAVAAGATASEPWAVRGRVRADPVTGAVSSLECASIAAQSVDCAVAGAVLSLETSDVRR